MSVLYTAAHSIFEATTPHFSDVRTYRAFVHHLNPASSNSRGADTSGLLLHLLQKAQAALSSQEEEEEEDAAAGGHQPAGDDVALSVYFGAISICCSEVEQEQEPEQEKEERGVSTLPCQQPATATAAGRVKTLNILLSIYESVCLIGQERRVIERTCAVLLEAAKCHGICVSRSSSDDNLAKRRRRKRAQQSRRRPRQSQTVGDVLFSELSDDESKSESDGESDSECKSRALKHHALAAVGKDKLSSAQRAFADASATATATAIVTSPSPGPLELVGAMLAHLPATVCHALRRPDLAVFCARKEDVFSLDPAGRGRGRGRGQGREPLADLAPAPPMREDRFLREMGEALRLSLFALRSHVLTCIGMLLGAGQHSRRSIGENRGQACCSAVAM